MSNLPHRSAVFKLRTVIGEAAGFAQLGELYRFGTATLADTVFVDCQVISWLDAHMTAGYVAVMSLLKTEADKVVKFINLAPRVAEILEHHGWLALDLQSQNVQSSR